MNIFAGGVKFASGNLCCYPRLVISYFVWYSKKFACICKVHEVSMYIREMDRPSREMTVESFTYLPTEKDLVLEERIQGPVGAMSFMNSNALQ